MNDIELQTVKKNVIAMTAFYGREFSDASVQLFVDVLSEAPFDQIMWALKKCTRDPNVRSMPTPAHVLSYLRPAEDPRSEAIDAVSRIHRAVVHHGRHWGDGFDFWAKEYGHTHTFKDVMIEEIGELGYETVRRFGGFTNICEMFNANASSAQAQLREGAMAFYTKSAAGTLELAPALPKNEVGDLISNLANLKQLK